MKNIALHQFRFPGPTLLTVLFVYVIYLVLFFNILNITVWEFKYASSVFRENTLPQALLSNSYAITKYFFFLILVFVNTLNLVHAVCICMGIELSTRKHR